jgi:AAHS family 3-hydroxyphenylpropionic acid transporter
MGSQSLLYGLAPDCYSTAIRGTGVGAAVFAGRTGSVVGPLLAAGLVGAGRSAGEVLMAIVPLAILGGVSAIALMTHIRKQETAANA